MSTGLATDGMYSGGGNGISTPPTVSNITPNIAAVPGTPGAFSAVFSVARVTPIEFDLTGIPNGCQILITMKYEHQLETYTILDFDGAFQWPFDVVGPSDNQIGVLSAEPVHVHLLPRGGWPAGVLTLKVAAGARASGI